MDNLAALLAAVLVASSAHSAGPEGGESPSEKYTVRIVNMQFEPAELVVKRGSRIEWVNDDFVPHTATATDGAFNSGSIAASSSWAYVTMQPGTHVYACALHPTMKGRLIVQ